MMARTAPKNKRCKVKPTEKGSQYAQALGHGQNSQSTELDSKRSLMPNTPSEITGSQPTIIQQQQDAHLAESEWNSINSGGKVQGGPLSSSQRKRKRRMEEASPPLFVQSDEETDELEPEEEQEKEPEASRGEGNRDSSTDEDILIVHQPRVNFMACWQAYYGKETLPCLQTSKESTRNLAMDAIFGWAKLEVNKQLLVKYIISSLTATVYFPGQPKGTH
ncbi:hypothetical protein EJ02DRAFT_478194 [Clathrospora elynae]|uniref:Uncharacterized protein n=1 Tax=Clathrospora elynae TaxID=706981 RepID=A0A6A5SI22_9PLEO|nr:hypothetical protein EJ02DRAFT_478194 [Clathrospora elynae]